MQYLFLFLGLVLSSCQARDHLSEYREVFNSKNGDNKTITDETLRQLMEAVKGIFDPDMTFNGFSYFKNDSSMFVNASVADIDVKGLTDFGEIYTKADMEALQFVVLIEFPTLNLTGKYDILLDTALGQDYNLHIFGNDSFSANASDIYVKLTLKLGLFENNTLTLSDFKLDFNISKVTVKFENIQGGGVVGDVLNDLINEALPDLVDIARPDVESLAEEKVLGLGHSFIDGLTLEQFIDYIYMIIDMGGNS